jgi:hypothetical protein
MTKKRKCMVKRNSSPTPHVVRTIDATFRRLIMPFVSAEGESDRGGLSDVRSCPNAHNDTAEIHSVLVGYIKGECAIHMACTCGERKRNFVSQYLLARG